MSLTLLVENNQKTASLYSVNLQTYVGSDVIWKKNLQEAKEVLKVIPEIHLIISRVKMDEEEIAYPLHKYLVSLSLDIPMIVLGAEPRLNEVAIVLPENTAGYVDLVRSAARILGVTGYGIFSYALSLTILFYLLSSCTIVWGALTGTFFGQEWLPQTVKPLIPALRDDRNIQAFCFLLGAVHLSIAHLWRTIVKLPSVRALSEIGWVLILWGAFFLANMLILGDAFPAFGKWLFIAGASLVVLFTNPTRNVFKGIGAGLGNLLLNVVNSFTDIVSYIRLFAVGLATVAVADAFNKMAMEIGYGSVTTGIVTSFILLLGHTLNLILGPMSILVHGVRLNVLEFCSHLDINWSGFSYKPLQGDETGTK